MTSKRKRMNVAEWSVYVWRRWLATSMLMAFCTAVAAAISPPAGVAGWGFLAIPWGTFTVCMVFMHELGLRRTLAASHRKELGKAKRHDR